MSHSERFGTLVVDDEDDIRLLIRLTIERWNRGMFVSGEAGDGTMALATLDAADPAVVVLDQTMPGIDGLQTAREILRQRPEQPIVLFSAFLDAEIERRAAEIGIARCLDKRRLRELPEILFALVRPTTS